MNVEGINSVSIGQGSQTATTTVKATPKAVESKPVEINNKPTVEISSDPKKAGVEPARIEGQASNEQIRQAVEKFNKEAISNGEAIFGIHDKTNRVMIKIVDKDTKEVIKEFPPEKTLDMIAKAWEMAGILVDERR